MKKLIELGVAIDAAIGAADEWDCDFSFERDRKIRDAFMALPTVDAVPVRHGRWVHHPEIGWGSTWLCSECGEKTVETIMGEPRYKFCPMCGAGMRKDGEGRE